MDEVVLLFETAVPADGLEERLGAELRLALGARIDCRFFLGPGRDKPRLS